MIETSRSLAPPVSFDRTGESSDHLTLSRDAALAVEAAWSSEEEPDLRRVWRELDPDGSPSVLTALIKADLHCRRLRGLSIAVTDYLDRFPQLQSFDNCVVSLVYEEYCLREEDGEDLDPEEFCRRYEPWKDSLISQLRYHRLLSEAVGRSVSALSSPSPSRKPARLPRQGERFLGFQLLDLLGEGGAAKVFLASEDALGNRPVALKISADRGHEPSIMGRLNDPRIVQVLSVSREPETGLRGLCMPYEIGVSLDKVVARVDPVKDRPRAARVFVDLIDQIASGRPQDAASGPRVKKWAEFPENGSYFDGVAWIVKVVAEALSHAHARGVLHRDVKPANILLTVCDGPKLLDFNLADEPEDAERARSSLRGGTPPYMAPEQLAAFFDDRRWKTVGPTADLYALGLVLRELLTGKRPPIPVIPPHASREEIAAQVVHREPPESPRRINPTVPRALDAIAGMCLATNPVHRYQHAADLVEDLNRFIQRRPLAFAFNPSRVERVRHSIAARRAIIVPVFVAFALLTACFTPPGRLFFHRLAVEDKLGRLRRTIEADPKSAAPHIELGVVLQELGRPKEAAEAFEDAAERPDAVEGFSKKLESTPRARSLWTGLGNAYFRKGPGRWPEKAAAAYEASLRIDPHQPLVWYVLSTIAFNSRHNVSQAHSFTTRAIHLIESDPGRADRDTWRVDLRRRRANYSIHWGESLLGSPNPPLDDARAHFEEAIEDLKISRKEGHDFDPSTKRTTGFLSAKALLDLGRVLNRLDRPSEALAAFRIAKTENAEAAHLEPGHAEDEKLRSEIDREIADALAKLAR